MLPSSEIRWLRSSAISLALLCGVLALILVSARQALQEIWPPRVQELVLVSGEVVFAPTGQPVVEQELLVRSFPRALLALEWSDGQTSYAYPLSRDPDADSWWMQFAHGVEVIDPTALRRYYAPNAMSPGERFGLLRARFAERRLAWQGHSPALSSDAIESSTESDQFGQ